MNATTLGRFGRYELRGVLGQGGFATVYRAWDPALGREVALKALQPHLATEPDVCRRFLAEARALAGLRHPNIVTVHDVGEGDGRPFFAMELVAGQSLDAWLRGGNRLTLEQVTWIVRGVADGLDALHEAGLVHRDVKPGNIMLEPGKRVVIMDLGIVRSLDHTQHTQALLGTPVYMAPEQITGRAVLRAADIYALGVVTYYMLAGRPPFEGDTARVLHAHVYEPPPPLRSIQPGLPAYVYHVLDAALEKDPIRRPATAGAFAAALAGETRPADPTIHDAPGRGFDDRPTKAMTPPTTATATGARPHRVTLAAIGVATALVIAVIVSIAIVAGRHTPKTQSISQTGGASNPATALTVATVQATPTVQSAAQAPSAPPPLLAPPLVQVSGLYLNNKDGWSKGQGDLQACFNFSGAGPGTVLHLRLASEATPDNPMVDGAAATVPAASGGPICADVPPQTLPPGRYLAMLYDALWRRPAQGELAFRIRGPEAVGLSADDPLCCLATLERVQPLDGNGVALSLSFAVHLQPDEKVDGKTPWWKGDSDPGVLGGIYLVDEQGHHIPLQSVSGDAGNDQTGDLKPVTGIYSFGALVPGTRWMWLHYQDYDDPSKNEQHALVLPIRLGAAAVDDGTAAPPLRVQQMDASPSGAAGALLTSDDRPAVLWAESDGNALRLVLSFNLSQGRGWHSPNADGSSPTIYLEDEQGRHLSLIDIAGPANWDDGTVLVTSGWYRFQLPAGGVHRVRLHYGGATVDIPLGAAAP